MAQTARRRARTHRHPGSRGAQPAGAQSPRRAHPDGALLQLGHKGDLILIHFRDSLEALNQVELDLAQTELYEFLDLRHSYVSVVELGLYESSRKSYEAAGNLEQHSPEWKAEIAATLARQSAAMAPRLYPAIPDAKYLTFYPMDRKRGEQVNWYTVPFSERQRMMHEHGLIGRRYGDVVKQIISAPSAWTTGSGCGSLRRRSRGLQEADLRDALR